MYTKEKARKIIKNHLMKIISLNGTIEQLKKRRIEYSKKIDSIRRIEMSDKMFALKVDRRYASSWVVGGIAETETEYRWLVQTSSIFYFSHQLSNLKKKVAWMKNITFNNNQTKKKIYFATKGDWKPYFSFLLDLEVVDNKLDADYIFYHLVGGLKSIVECVDDSNKTPKKLIVCLENNDLKFLYPILKNNNTTYFTNLEETIDFFEKI